MKLAREVKLELSAIAITLASMPIKDDWIALGMCGYSILLMIASQTPMKGANPPQS